MNAVVYTSNTGFTKQYALLLGQQLGLPVFSLPEAQAKLPASSEILYLGWQMAGKIKGYSKAAKSFRPAAVCGVGMGPNGSQLEELRKANRIAPETPLFSLQGGYDPKNLHGIYRLMMNTAEKTIGRSLLKNEHPTPEETDMLDLLNHGGNRVCLENLKPVLEWYGGAAK